MISAVLLVLAAATPWSTMDEAQRAEAMTQIQKLPTMRERILAASEGFLGTAYLLSPLGEGEGKDADPLIRFDAVDCLTLVEESFALSCAPPASLVERLSAIRYAGTPSWDNRLHVMESQWIPEQLARGNLKDVTRQFGGDETRVVKKVITAQTWKEKGALGLGLSAEHQLTGAFTLDVIPAALAPKLLATAPAGLLVVVVRADRPWLVTRVSHVGVLVQGTKGPMLRHASRSFKKVVDEPLSRYVSRNLDFGTWTIEGLALFEPQLP